MDEEVKTTETAGQVEGQPETQPDAAAQVEAPAEAVNWEQRYKDLQSDHTRISQESAKNQQLIEVVSPHVNWQDLERAQRGESPESSGDEMTFVSKKELNEHLRKVEQRMATQNFVQEFRQNHPDLADRGPKEEMVRFFFEQKTLKTDPFDKRLKNATDSARNFLKVEQQKGKDGSTQKDAEAAAAGGLISATPKTSPKPEPKEETPQNYVDSLRDAQERKKLTNF